MRFEFYILGESLALGDKLLFLTFLRYLICSSMLREEMTVVSSVVFLFGLEAPLVRADSVSAIGPCAAPARLLSIESCDKLEAYTPD